MSHAMTAKEISLKLAGKQILDTVTFEIQKGEIFGLLGPSGAGKTTLIKILTGQLVQDSGYASILGKDTRKLSALEHRQVGIMMDSFGLYDRLSVYDNLLYDDRNKAVSKLSKGMKNRLSLARALMNHAEILFLDEPTSGLDPVTTKEIHAVLSEQRERGTTIFLTTHNMFEAESLCDHVALLNEGQIIEYGEPMDICRKYNYLNKLRVTLKDGKTVLLENGSASALQMKEYLENGVIEAIHSTEPTLESVFTRLTGKELDCYE